jgi:hypothetical protein
MIADLIALLAIIVIAVVIVYLGVSLSQTQRRLDALRRNAYLTDKDGARRKYYNVRAELRERAEASQ